MNRITLCFAAAAMALGSMVPCHAATGQTLVYQGNPQAHATTPVCIELFESIREKTGGSLQIKFAGMGSVVRAEATFTSIRDGMLDMGMFSPSDAITTLPLNNAAGFPWQVRDAAHGARVQKVLLEEIAEMRAEVGRHLHLLTQWTSDRNCILSLKSAVRSPADLAGKRVMTWTPGLVEEIKSYGGIPVSIGSGDAYVGLQRGMGDAVYCQLPMVKALKLHEVARFATPMAPSSVMPLYAGMNLDVWESLTPAEQAAVTGEAAEWGVKMGEVTKADGDETIRIMRESGCEVVELSPEETQAFEALSMPVLRGFWVKMLGSAQVKDPEGYLGRVAALVAGVR